MSSSLPIVVYVCRYQDEDSAGKFARFFDSYKQLPAGYEHELFIIKKGFQEHEDIWDVWTQQLDGISYQIRAYPDRHFVFGYVRNLMEEFPDRYIFVCNATCEILVDQWLDLYMRHANPNRILGAMGSYDSFYSNYVANFSTIPPLTLKNFIRSSSATRSKWWRSFFGYDVQPPQHPCYNADNFYPHPNPLLRTLAIMLPPRLLERIFYWPRSENVHSKDDEYLFEMGKFGLTAQALLAGLEPLVVGADGRTYAIEEWPQSKTFWSGNQENLIIADRWSRHYDKMPADVRNIMQYHQAYEGLENLNRYFEQVMSSDTSQIEAFFLKSTGQNCS